MMALFNSPFAKLITFDGKPSPVIPRFTYASPSSSLLRLSGNTTIHLRISFVVTASLVREYYNSPTHLLRRHCFACPGILQFTYASPSSSLLRLSGNTTLFVICMKKYLRARRISRWHSITTVSRRTQSFAIHC